MRHRYLFLAQRIAPLLLLTLPAGMTAATLFAVDPWRVPPNNFPYPVINASCGDLVQFVWARADHGVFRLYRNASGAAGNCPDSFNATVGTELAPINSTGNLNYTVQEQDTPFTWLVCQSDRHCGHGQKLMLNVTCGNATVPSAAAPQMELPFAGNGSDLTQASSANKSLP